MAIPNRDEVRGKFRRAKGAVKETIGRATNDAGLIRESQDDKAAGRTQEQLGRVRRKVGDAVKDLGEAIRK